MRAGLALKRLYGFFFSAICLRKVSLKVSERLLVSAVSFLTNSLKI